MASGTVTPSGIDEIVVHAKSVATFAGAWKKESDTTAADGLKMRNPNAGAAKLEPAQSGSRKLLRGDIQRRRRQTVSPVAADEGGQQLDGNDSVFVQFTNSQTGSGTAAWRIGTTSALVGFLEEGSGAGVSGWGWNDNAYGSVGAPIYFATSGTQRIRIQVREDGVSIDQIVLSAPSTSPRRRARSRTTRRSCRR